MAALAVAGCGTDASEDGVTQTSSAISGTWISLHIGNGDDRLNFGPYGENFPNNDWSPGNYKAECGFSGSNEVTAVVGVSYHRGGEIDCNFWGNNCKRDISTDAVLCSTSSMSIDQYYETKLHAVAGQSTQLDHTWGDWAFGHEKLECLPAQAVTAVSGWGDILCSRISNFKSPPTSCNVRWFNGQESRGTTERGDWAFGSYKGECGPNEYVKGVAYDHSESVTALGFIGAILCCTPGR